MRPVLVPAEMAGRELMRRRTALALLTALPLAFYAAHASDGPEAIEVGGLTMAFSISGAAIFTVISARRVDRRLALAGYRSWQLMLGRVAVLTLLGAIVAAAFALVMTLGSSPERPWALLAGVQLTALVGVPFGIAVGALAPRELDAVLVMIGVVGIQLSLHTSDAVAKALPFWAPRRVLEFAAGEPLSAATMTSIALAWTAALLAAAAAISARRVRIARPARLPRRTQPVPERAASRQ